MHRFYPILFLILLFTSCSDAVVPELGQMFILDRHLVPSYIYYKVRKTAPAQHLKVDGVTYLIAVNNPKEQKVVYVGTLDPNFESPEGYSLETTYSELISATGKGAKQELGWGWYQKLPSGWYACFMQQRKAVEEPDPGTKVDWFCKREF